MWPWVWCPSRKWVRNSHPQSTHRVSFLCKNPVDAEKSQSPHSTGAVLTKAQTVTTVRWRTEEPWQRLAMGWTIPRDLSEAILSILLSPAEVFSDQRPIHSLRAPGKVALGCQQPLRSSNCALSRWNLQAAGRVLCDPSLLPGRPETSCRQTPNRNSS